MSGQVDWPLTDYTTCTRTEPHTYTRVHALTIQRRLFSPSPTGFWDIEQLETRQMLGLFFEMYRVAESEMSIGTELEMEVVTMPDNDGIFAYTFWGFMDSNSQDVELLDKLLTENKKVCFSLPRPGSGSHYEEKKRMGQEFRYLADKRALKNAWAQHYNMSITASKGDNKPDMISGEQLTLRLLFSPSFALSARQRGACHRLQDNITMADCYNPRFFYTRPTYVYSIFDINTSPASIFAKMLPDVQLLRQPPQGSLAVDALRLTGGRDEGAAAEGGPLVVRGGTWTLTNMLFENDNHGNVVAGNAAPLHTLERVNVIESFNDLVDISEQRLDAIDKISKTIPSEEEEDDDDWGNKFSVGPGLALARARAARILYKNHGKIVAAQLFSAFHGDNARSSPYHKAVFNWAEKEGAPKVQLLPEEEVLQYGEFVARENARWRTYLETLFVAPLHMDHLYFVTVAILDSSNTESCSKVLIAFIFRRTGGDNGKSFVLELACSFIVRGAYLGTTSHITPRAFTSSDREQVGEVLYVDDANASLFGVPIPGTQVTGEMQSSISRFKQLLTQPDIGTRSMHVDPATGARTLMIDQSLQLRSWLFSMNSPILATGLEEAFRTRLIIPHLCESTRVRKSLKAAIARQEKSEATGRRKSVEQANARRRYRWEHVGSVEMHRAVRAKAVSPMTRAGLDVLWNFLCDKAWEAGYTRRETRDTWRFYTVSAAIAGRSVFSRHYATKGGKFAQDNRKRGREEESMNRTAFDPRTIVEPAVDRSMVVFLEHAICALGVSPDLLIDTLERDVRLALYRIFSRGDLNAQFAQEKKNYVRFEFRRDGKNAGCLLPLGEAVKGVMQGIPGWQIQPCADTIAEFLYRASPSARHVQRFKNWTLPDGIEGTNAAKFAALVESGSAEAPRIEMKEIVSTRTMMVYVHIDYLHPKGVPPHAKLQIALWLKEFCAFRHQGGFHAFFGAQPTVYAEDTAAPWILYFPRASPYASELEIDRKTKEKLQCSVDVYAAVSRAKTSYVVSSPLAEWTPRLAVPRARAGFGSPHFVGTPVEFDGGNHFTDLRCFVESLWNPADANLGDELETCRVAVNAYHWDKFPPDMFAESYVEFMAGNDLEDFKMLFLRWESLREYSLGSGEALLRRRADLMNLAKYKIVCEVPEIRDGLERCRKQWVGEMSRDNVNLAEMIAKEVESAAGMIGDKCF